PVNPSPDPRAPRPRRPPLALLHLQHLTRDRRRHAGGGAAAPRVAARVGGSGALLLLPSLARGRSGDVGQPRAPPPRDSLRLREVPAGAAADHRGGERTGDRALLGADVGARAPARRRGPRAP